MRQRVRLQSVAFAALLVLAADARAGHPFITDDPKTQGKGRFELELGTQYTRTPVDDFTLANFQFAPQLSYGAEETLDLILRPTYNINVASGGVSARASGFGDTNLEFKWRFWQSEGSSLGIKAGTGIPSGNFDRALDSGRSTPRAYLLLGQSTDAVDFYVNAGTIRNIDAPGARDWQGHASALAVWKVREGLQVGLDFAADQNPVKGLTQWPAVALIGAICSLSSAWDIDFGYQRGLNHSAPNNQFRLGTTLRW